MRSATSYKCWVISGESFQREKDGPWVSQYFAVQDQDGKGYSFPSQQYQLNDVFWTEDEADDFALFRAREWIDKNHSQPGLA
jgi:hypothetical protein